MNNQTVRELKYMLPIIILPLVALVPMLLGGYWTFFTIIFVFVMIPAIEFFNPGSTENLTKEQEAIERKRLYYDLLLYCLVPMQYILLGVYLYKISYTPVEWYEFIGMTTIMGVGCGVLGINVAHELGHRGKKFEQILSKALLLTSLYMHFFIEHNRGHHKNIATRFDPATSRLGEPVYTFYIRTIRDSWLSAWHLERHRLSKTGQPFWSLHNEMLRYQLIQIGFVLAIALVFGWKAMLGFLGAALIGALLLETVNYIEHYGLERQEISPGRFEKVKPHHSWNSNHSLGRLLLFELTRHSDHHYNAGRKYQILRHFDNAPQMPTGYPGMMLCALVPPLWFRVMDPRVFAHKVSFAELEINRVEESEAA